MSSKKVLALTGTLYKVNFIVYESFQFKKRTSGISQASDSFDITDIIVSS